MALPWHSVTLQRFSDRLAAFAEDLWFGVLELWRAGPVHQNALAGEAPAGIAVAVRDPRVGDERRGQAMLSGSLVLGEERIDLSDNRSPFDGFLEGHTADLAHAFAWLPDLLAAGLNGRALAKTWTLSWIERFGRYDARAWTPALCGARVCALLGPGGEMLADAPPIERARILAVIGEQLRHLARADAINADPDGQWARALALALAHAVLDNADVCGATFGPLEKLVEEAILPDGGHAFRAPDRLLDAMTDLAVLDLALGARGQHLPEALSAALDRGTAALRFFRMPDGDLCTLAGSGEGDTGALAAALDDAEPHAPFASAHHCGFQRIDAGNTVFLIDVGGPPARPFHPDCTAAPLAFELADGQSRMVVSVGPGAADDTAWRDAARATAASSTITLADTSADIPRAQKRGGYGVRGRRADSPDGPWLEARHDWYLDRFGLAHRRRIAISLDGLSVIGEDTLFRPIEEKGGIGIDPIPWAMRFHLHPDVRAGLARDGKSVILELDNGKAWRFRADGGPVTLEASLYTGGQTPRPTRQIVVTGLADPADSGIGRGNSASWSFAREGASA